MEEKNKDKRHRERVHFATDFCLIVDGKETNYSETIDISMEGVFVVTDTGLNKGTKGNFRFRLSLGSMNGPEIKGSFEVVNSQHKHGETGKDGMGIKFTELDSDSSIELYRITQYNRPSP